MVYVVSEVVASPCGRIIHSDIRCSLSGYQAERILDYENLSSVLWIVFHRTGRKMQIFSAFWVCFPSTYVHLNLLMRLPGYYEHRMWRWTQEVDSINLILDLTSADCCTWDWIWF